MIARRLPQLLLLVGSILFVGCSGSGAGRMTGASGPKIVQPGAPGQPSRLVDPSDMTPQAARYTAADVAFMQGMIGHHAQALDMTALIEARSQATDLRLLGRRIAVSQKSEISMMQKWLRDRGEMVPDATAEHMMMGHMEAMPGMLSPQQMESLKASSGEEFYRLFLEYMIQHHAGAITMVDTLFSQDGAAQDTDIFRFASDVFEDQTMEITRMRNMLEAAR